MPSPDLKSPEDIIIDNCYFWFFRAARTFDRNTLMRHVFRLLSPHILEGYFDICEKAKYDFSAHFNATLLLTFNFVNLKNEIYCYLTAFSVELYRTSSILRDI